MTTGKGKVKVKLFLCLINEAPHHEDMVEWRYSSTIFDLGPRWKWMVSFKSRSLHSQYLLDRRLAEPQSRSGRCGEESCREIEHGQLST
jgi:hypothetical protein